MADHLPDLCQQNGKNELSNGSSKNSTGTDAMIWKPAAGYWELRI